MKYVVPFFLFLYCAVHSPTAAFFYGCAFTAAIILWHLCAYSILLCVRWFKLFCEWYTRAEAPLYQLLLMASQISVFLALMMFFNSIFQEQGRAGAAILIAICLTAVFTAILVRLLAVLAQGSKMLVSLIRRRRYHGGAEREAAVPGFREGPEFRRDLIAKVALDRLRH
jgi:hypothetical protein